MTRSTKSATPKHVPTKAVQLAINDGNVRLVAKWIEGGGVVDEWMKAKDGGGRIIMSTPLMVASSASQLPVVELLLERGASVDLQTSRRVTALMYAAYGGDAAIVRRLLRAGAQVGLRSLSGDTARMLADNQGNHECVRAFREHVEAAVAAQLKKADAEACAPAVLESVDEGSARGRSPPKQQLAIAVNEGDAVSVEAWLDSGGQVDCGWRVSTPTQNVREVTPLMLACGNGHMQLVDLLLERGANVNLQDSSGVTALINAAYNGNATVVRRLLRAGAQIGQRTQNGHTAPVLAQKYSECARVLREHEEAVAAESREHESAMVAEKRARRKDKKRAAKTAAQAAKADKAAAVTAAAEAARLEHEETVRRHEEREAAERARTKAAEDAKRAHVAAQRQAKAQAPPKPLTPTSQPAAPKAKAERVARRNEVADLEHQVHINPEQRAIRAAAFKSRQVVVKEGADIKKAHAQAKALKEASARASAKAEAACHVVPSAPTMSDMMAGKLG